MDFISKIGGLRFLEKGLAAATLRQEVFANNLANVETPGFKKSIVVFESVLQDVLKSQTEKFIYKTHINHLPGVVTLPDPNVVTVKNTSMRNDYNNVDIDQEMAALAKNTIMFQSLAEQLSRQLSMIRMAIT